MERRYFLGLLLDGEAGEQLRDVTSPLGELRPCRLIPPSKYHVTVAFFGSCELDHVIGIEPDLRRLAEATSAFDVTFRSLATFPHRKNPDAVVVALADPVPALSALHDGCREIARVRGLPDDPSPYRPHCTLARTKRPFDPDERARFLAIKKTRFDVRWTPRAIALVESADGPQGSVYTPLVEAPFAAI